MKIDRDTALVVMTPTSTSAAKDNILLLHSHLRGTSLLLSDQLRELHTTILDDSKNSSSSVIINNYNYFHPRPTLENKSAQQQDQQSAFWGTDASFLLLAQGTVILCMIFVLVYCTRKLRQPMTWQHIASIVARQEWAASMTMTTATLRSRSTVDSSIGGENDNSTGDQNNNCPCRPNALDRFLTMSRIAGRALVHPFRALWVAVNDWATGSYDEAFLRQLMERIEAEREAEKEDPKERVIRLKEAFVKAGTVWVLGSENFRTPEDEALSNNFSIPESVEVGPEIEETLKVEETAESCRQDISDDRIREINCGNYEMYDGVSCKNVDFKENANNQCMEVSGVNDDDGLGNNDIRPSLCPEIEDLPHSAVSVHGYDTQPTAAEQSHTCALLRSIPPSLELSAVCINDISPESNHRFIYIDKSIRNSLTSMDADSMVSSSATEVQKVSNQCAICLCDYEKGDTIVISSCDECPHAFHQDCLLEWLVKMQVDAPCPCCRRTFIDLDSHLPRHHNYLISTLGNTATDATQVANNLSDNRSERRRWRMSSGRQSSNRTDSRVPVEEISEVERLHEQWVRQIIEQELRRRRAFNASVISLR